MVPVEFGLYSATATGAYDWHFRENLRLNIWDASWDYQDPQCESGGGVG